MAARHIALLRPSPRAAATAAVPHAWDDEQREQGRRRRERERRVRELVSRWVQEALVVVVMTEATGMLVEVAVTAPRDFLRAAQPAVGPLRLPVQHAAEWRPRLADTMWTEPYRTATRVLAWSVRHGGHEVVDDVWSASGGAVRDLRSRFGNCIERALVHIYHGVVQRERSTLVVPEVRVGTRRARSSAADRRGGRRGAREFGERVLEDRQKVRRLLEAAVTTPYGPPGLYTAAGRDAVADAYILARLAAPSRNSAAEHGPTLLASCLFALCPHLVPCAPDARTASLLGHHAHEALAAAESGWLADLEANAAKVRAAARPRSLE